ncbi:MAG: PAS domain S-box protein, partial [Ferruginibacter sp.]
DRKIPGTYRWFLLKALPVRNEENEIIKWVGTYTDIDEQKKVAEKIRIAEEFSRNVLQSSPDCMKVLDTAGQILFMNTNGLCQMEIDDFGTVKNKHWWKLWGEDNKSIIDAALTKALGGETAQFMAHCPTAKGKLKWWDVLVSPVTSSNGTVTQLIAVSRDITERKKMEEMLKYRKALLEAQNETIPDALLIVDTKGKMLSYNQNFVTLWKMPDDIIKLQDDSAALQFAKTQVTNPERFIESVNYSYTHPGEIAQELLIFKDGRFIERYGNSVTGEDGTSYGWAWYFRDITENKNFEIAIRDSEKRFRQMADAMPQKVWTADLKGDVNYLNNQWYDYTQKSFEELKGWGWKTIIHPDDWGYNLKTWEHSIKTGEDYQLEHRFLRHDNVYRWHLSRGLPQKDVNGKIISWIGTHTDIHDQKTIAEENFLLEFAEEFASYTTGSEFFGSLVTYIAHKTGMDYAFIGALTEKPGQETDSESKDFTIKTIAIAANGKLVPNIEYPLPYGPCEQVIRGTVYSFPRQCRITFPKNKMTVEYNVEGYIGYPLFGQDGNAIGLVAVMNEKEILNAEYISALLRLIARRAEFEMEQNKFSETLKATNLDLKTAAEELRQTNLQLAQFAHAASHDLQEPLRKILTFITMLQEKYSNELADGATMLLHKISSATLRMRTLIQDLLNYSHVINHEELFVSTDLNDTLRNVLNDFELVIDQNEAVIKSDILPVINAIPFQVNQLFYNLIGNALKFSKNHVPPAITVSSRILPALEINNYPALNPLIPYFEIIFADKGVGFAQKYGEQIFTIFKRLHNKEAYSGTGIGLSICKKIVENHAGEIFAEGEENNGSAFHVILPVSLPQN